MRIIHPTTGDVSATLCAHPNRLSDTSCAGLSFRNVTRLDSEEPFSVTSDGFKVYQPEKVESVSVTSDGVLLVPAYDQGILATSTSKVNAQASLLAFGLTSAKGELKELWRYALGDSSKIEGPAQAVTAQGELIVVSSLGSVHILGAMPYLPATKAHARVSVQWTLAGVAAAKLNELNADRVADLTNIVKGGLTAVEGVNVQSLVDVLVPAMSRAGGRRAAGGGGGTLVIDVCVKLAPKTEVSKLQKVASAVARACRNPAECSPRCKRTSTPQP